MSAHTGDPGEADTASMSGVMMTVFADDWPPECQSPTVTWTMLTPVIIRLKETGEARIDTHPHHPLVSSDNKAEWTFKPCLDNTGKVKIVCQEDCDVAK